jgi:hypothetical protein
MCPLWVRNQRFPATAASAITVKGTARERSRRVSGRFQATTANSSGATTAAEILLSTASANAATESQYQPSRNNPDGCRAGPASDWRCQSTHSSAKTIASSDLRWVIHATDWTFTGWSAKSSAARKAPGIESDCKIDHSSSAAITCSTRLVRR